MRRPGPACDAVQGALGDRETFIAALRKADGYARHAVALAPELAEAHRALGLNQPYGDPVGIAHLHRAAELVPNDAENQFALAAASNATGVRARVCSLSRALMRSIPCGSGRPARWRWPWLREATAPKRRLWPGADCPRERTSIIYWGGLPDLRGLFGGGQALDDCLAGVRPDGAMSPSACFPMRRMRSASKSVLA